MLVDGDAEMEVVRERVLAAVMDRIDGLLGKERETIRWD